MQPRDHHVLVVARIAQHRAVGAIRVRDPGDVLVHPARPDLQLRDRPVCICHVQVGAEARPATESRSSAGVRVFGEVSGFCGTPSCEV